jgi:hypothetical protein
MNLLTDPRFETELERVSTGIMGETESSTPRSTTEPPQLKAAKDKNCPFCGQAFTSSSLGRHLDLYIRPKNPKTADGIHLVDEIRKLRGGITRRQAKGSVSLSRKDDSRASTPVIKKQSVTSADSSTLVQSPEEEDDDEELQVGKTRTQFKDVSWGNGKRQPPRALGAKTPDLRRDVSRQMQKADLDQRFKTGEEVEIASATEMALRELLKSVQEAKYVSFIHQSCKTRLTRPQHQSFRLNPLRLRSIHAQLPLVVPPDPPRTLDPLFPDPLSYSGVLVHYPARPEAARSLEQACP